MQRLLVALLAAFDSAIAAAVGLAALLAPLTLLWTVAFGVTADWGALWPLSGTLWQFGHGVAIDVTVPTETMVEFGIPLEGAAFVLSITPLAFLVFTLLFAARSGARAASAGAWLLGSLSGAAVFALIATGVALTARLDMAHTALLPAIAMPTIVYLVGAVVGAVRIVWEDGDGGPIDRLHDVVDGWGEWAAVPAAAVRGAAFALIGVVAASALAVALMALVRGGEVIALFQAARVDGLGVVMIALAHFAYLPTAIVWAASWIAGPGFAIGAGTAVSPAGTQLGIVPGIPMLGLVPENDSFWMLVVVLVPIAAGAFAGWAVRSRLVWEGTPLAAGPRAAISGGIALLTLVVAGVAAALANGSMGPGRLAVAGPAAWPFGLALGAEVLIGAAILLLSPRHRDELAEERTDRWVAEMAASGAVLGADDIPVRLADDADADGPASSNDTVPLDELGAFRIPPRSTGDSEG